MPKRKAVAKSDLNGDYEEDIMQIAGSDRSPDAVRDVQRPAKRGRGRPKTRSSNATGAGRTAPGKSGEQPDGAPKKTGKRGRPPGGRASLEKKAQAAERKDESTKYEASMITSNDELDALQGTSGTPSKPAKPAATRDRRHVENQVLTDAGFQYSPTSARHKSLGKLEKQPAAGSVGPETQHPAQAADETIQHNVPARRSLSASPTKTGFNRLAAQRVLQNSPSKRKLGGTSDETIGDPDLRRRLGDLTKRYDILETRYNRVREIGVVQANTNMDKLRKHCETITEDSNKLVAALREELEAQRDLGKQSRILHKQLQERDAEVAQFKDQVEESAAQLSSAQSEVKALQTKLAAARNTASTLESATAKGPGSAARSTPVNRAQSSEVAQATQLAQLKEDLYCDLTGLIVRDVKKRETDHLYDCIQTGTNGTLHFKLAVPHVSAANFESAEFQYIPLLDENRDRDLVNLLPDYLTVDITFSRQQASKFYTRVIDALMKRRTSQDH